MAIDFNDNLQIKASKHIDDRYGPWTSIEEALLNIPIPYRKENLTLCVNGIEYWFTDGVGDNNLVVKTTDTSKWENHSDQNHIIPKEGKRIRAEIIDDLPTTDLSSYTTKTYVDTQLLTKSNANHNHSLNNLTEKSYNSLTEKPTIPSISGLATTTQVAETYATKEELGITVTQTTVNGSISGNMICAMPFQSTMYKKAIIFLNNFNGDGTYIFPTKFTGLNNGCLTYNFYFSNITNSLTCSHITLDIDGLSITFSTISNGNCMIIVEGY